MASEDYIPTIFVTGWSKSSPKLRYIMRKLGESSKLHLVSEEERKELDGIVDGILFLPPDLLQNRELAKERFQETYSLVSNEISCICIWLGGDAEASSRLEEDLELKKLGCEYTLLSPSFFKKESFEMISCWFREHINERCQIKPAKD